MPYHNCDGIKFLKSLKDQSVDGIFTDPPWGRGPDIRGQRTWKNLVRQLDREAMRVLKPGGRVLIWVGTRMLSDLLNTMKHLEYRWCIYEMHIPSRYMAGFQIRLDPIVYFALPGTKYMNVGADGKKIDQIYQQISKGRSDTKHPCAREITTVRGILKSWFKEGEYIVDPFAGSDTLGFACRTLNNPYDSCEIDPKMYRYGQHRNSQHRNSQHLMFERNQAA